MRKIIIALVSFMMGMVLFLPYRTIFTYATERIISEYNIPLTYRVDRAFLFSATYRGLSLGLSDRDISLPETTLRITPLGYLSDATVCRIHSEGIDAVIRSLKGAYVIDLRMSSFRVPSLDNVTLKGTIKIEVAREDRGTGNISVDLTDLRLPLMGSTIKLKKVSGKGSFRKGRITIEGLSIRGGQDIDIKGFLIPNHRAFENSTVNLDVVIKSNGSKTNQKIRGQLKNLLRFINIK